MGAVAWKVALLKVSRIAFFLVFLSILVAVVTHIMSLLRGGPGEIEGIVESAANLMVFFAITYAFARLGADMIEAWERSKE